ncbi:MAG TPA: hypothetical protein VGG25_11810 [Streptosporangiaceae bacterium]|jgi:hypothetical protein
MPTGSEFQQIIRARMAVTGEKYTTAMRAVVAAAEAAIPRGRHDPAAFLHGLAGSRLSAFVLSYLPTVADRRDGDRVLVAIADLCQYESGWRKERAARYRLDPRNDAVSRRLLACASDLAAIQSDDPRVMAIAAAWADENTAGLMQDFEQGMLDWLGFGLSGEQLIDYLAGKAVYLLLDPEGV